MRRIEVAKGEVFGKLKVIEFTKTSNRGPLYKCLCRCGNHREFAGKDLRNGNNKSCGCLTQSHGMTGSRPYRVWSNMKKRCNNEMNPDYPRYGGRGITYCPKWETFEGFWEDMKDGYRSDLTLDRIDVNGNYIKENCRWINRKKQNNNRRNNNLYEYKGETLTLPDICEKYGYDYSIIRARVQSGMTIDEAFRFENEKEEITYNGETKTVSEFARDNDMTYHQLKKRLMRGWTVERAIEQPLRIR
ncbi:hypothetical protein [Salibacterium halotolerans]|uniref:hypothetical protein n=1 Tax=Salibacterium halotolerans TaxID=1884432 RepID=UPI000B860E72|nr:hypothetical protein [Salibacterium halotolerans]